MVTDTIGNNCYYTCHGKIIGTPEELAVARASGQPLRAWPRLLGGKGGFGSLLRSIGSQIDKTTNKEMCRDLSGRRMRDVNNQKRLADWAAGAGARAAERQKRREERRQRRRQLLASADGPSGHVMEDGSYLVEKDRIVDSVFTAVKEALDPTRKRSADGTAAASGPSSSSAGPSRPVKLAKKWLDADLAELESGSGSSSSSSDDSNDANSNEEEAQGEAAEPEHSEQLKEIDDKQAPEVPVEKPVISEQQKQPLEAEVEPSNDATAEELMDLSTIDSLEAAEALGLDRLKNQLRLRGLKCGGNLRDRAQRLLDVRGLAPEQYPPALLAKPPRK